MNQVGQNICATLGVLPQIKATPVSGCLLEAIVIGDYQEPDHFFFGSNVVNIRVLINDDKVLGDLPEAISQETIYIGERVPVLILRILVVRFTFRDPVLISNTVSHVSYY